MLLQIRKSLTSAGMFILLALLIASFAFWGAGGGFSQQGGVVATVGSQEITIFQVRDAFESEMTRIREQYGSSITNEQALEFGLHRQALNQLILTAALDEEAENLGLMGSDEEVREMIRQMEFFYDLTGNFSTVAYEQALNARGWSKQEFEERVRVDIARQQLIQGVTDTSLVPAIMQDTLFSFRKEARRAEIATIPASAVGQITPPSEEQLLAFYETRKTNFQSPEYRDLSFFILTPADFAKAAQFTEEELRAEYDRRYDEFHIPARRAFEVAILRTEDQARELIERVNAGEDFTAVAAELTGVEAKDLLGGPSSYEELTTAFSERAADAIFNTGIGDLTPPLETLVSWQVFRVSDEIAGSETPFEEVREDLRQKLSEEEGIDALFDAVGVVDDEIAAGASMEEIAEALDKPIINIPAVTATGQTPEGALIEETRVFPFIQEAFMRHMDDPLEFPQSEEGEEFYMIRVNEIIPPEVRPFEEIRDQVRQLWLQEENIRLLGAVAREAEAAAKGGESLTSIANRYGGVRFETGLYVRDRVFTRQEISRSIATLMFSLGQGEVGVEQDSRGSGYVLVKVLEIQKQEPDPANPEYQALLARLSVEMKNDLFAQFQANLQKAIKISVNEEALENLFDPSGQAGLFAPQ